MGTIYSTKNDWVYFHVPKTGGTWLSEVLMRHGQDLHQTTTHSDIIYLQRRGLVSCEALSFAFVRHPFTWYPSLWGEIRKQYEIGLPVLRHMAVINYSFDMNEFIWNCVMKRDVWKNHMCRFTPEATKIYHFENFRENSKAMLRFLLKDDFRPEIMNKRPKNVQRRPLPLLDPLVKDLILEKNYDLLRELGYHEDGSSSQTFNP